MFASTGGYNLLAFNLIFSRQEKRYRKYYPPQVVSYPLLASYNLP